MAETVTTNVGAASKTAFGTVKIGNGLHVNPSTGMVEVPVDTTAGLGYGSNGLEVEVDGSTIDFNASGQLTALGVGGAVTQKVVSVSNNSTISVGNLTMQVLRGGVYFIILSQLENCDALLINAAIPESTNLQGPGFYFTCADGKNAKGWLVNGMASPDLISTQFNVPVLGGYIQRDAETYSQSYCTCAASKTRLEAHCSSSSRKSFYLHPFTVIRYY